MGRRRRKSQEFYVFQPKVGLFAQPWNTKLLDISKNGFFLDLDRSTLIKFENPFFSFQGGMAMRKPKIEGSDNSDKFIPMDMEFGIKAKK